MNLKNNSVIYIEELADSIYNKICGGKNAIDEMKKYENTIKDNYKKFVDCYYDNYEKSTRNKFDIKTTSNFDDSIIHLATLCPEKDNYLFKKMNKDN